MLIEPTDDIAESPMELVRLPLSVTTRVYDDSNPATAERETYRETPINAGIALPLLLELDLVNWIAQFRNEPLHLESPLFPVASRLKPCLASVYRQQGVHGELTGSSGYRSLVQASTVPPPPVRTETSR